MNAPRVLVTVGTDVHPFDRLLGWTAALAQEAPSLASWQVQHGWSDLPAPLQGMPFLDHDALRTAMADAAVVVSHGGPSTIAESRRHGVLPIVVPRRAQHDEHVDDHQLRFARRLAEAGLVLIAEDEQAFRGHLQRALADPSSVVLDRTDDDRERARAVAMFAAAVEPLLSSRPRVPVARRVARVLRFPRKRTA